MTHKILIQQKQVKTNILIERPKKEKKYVVSPSQVIEEEDTIHLHTLPEVDVERAEKVASMVNRNEAELS